MSFGGSTSNYPAEPARPLGLPEDRLPSMEADQPWPWFCGTRPFGLILLSERFNVRIDPVYQETKKDAVEVGKNVYVDQVAGLCLGTVDAVQQIKIDEEVVWDGPLYRGASEYEDITVEGRGTIRIYWGSETQPIDSDLEAEGHPGYRGKCYVYFIGFFCGYQQEQLPAVVFVLSRWPSFSFCSESNIEGDCNPAAVRADLFTHPRVGLGWPLTRLNATRYAALAVRFAADCFGISPVVDSNESLQSVLARFDEHCGTIPVPGPESLEDWQVIREWPAADPYISIDEADLLEEPEEDPQKANETKTEIVLTYRNRDNGYKSDYITRPNNASFSARAENRPSQEDRDWYTRPVAAQVAAAILGPAKALQDERHTLHVRQSSIVGLALGDLLRLSYGHTELCGLPLRCVDISRPSPEKPEAVIGCRLDRGHLYAQHVVPGDVVSAGVTSYTATALAHQRILELPAGQPIEQTLQRIVVLASRPTTTTTGIRVHLQKPGGSYLLASSGANARHGVLVDDYAADTLLVDADNGLVVQLDGVDLTLPNTPREDALGNEWLAFVNGEILSLFGATLLAAGKYRLGAIRARYDTTRATHSAGDDVYIIPLASVPVVTMPDSRTLATVKVQPVAVGGALDLAEVDAELLGLQYRNLRPLRPTGLRLNDRLVGATYPTGGDVDITWHATPDRKASYWDAATTGLPEAMILVFDATDALVATKAVAAGVTSYYYPNADLVADLGSEQDFSVRVHQVRNGLPSTLYAAQSIIFV